MNEAIEIHFGENPDDEIAFIVKGRRFPEATDYYGANWLLIDVVIRAGRFSGEVSGEGRNESWHDFYKELFRLYETLKGKATLIIDQRLTMTVEAQTRGHIRIYGALDDADFDSNTLNFNFFTDQTYLNIPLRQLAKMIERYPILP
jgi:hypothetical protein